MAKVHLHSQLEFDDFANASNTKTIIDSDTFRNGRWKELTKQANFPTINKFVFPVDMSHVNLIVLTEVPAGVNTRSHNHNEPIFRYVTNGSFILNGKTYKEGDWVYVPAGVDYQIQSPNGYATIAGYGMACGGGGLKLLQSRS
jgi:hypothetical protein